MELFFGSHSAPYILVPTDIVGNLIIVHHCGRVIKIVYYISSTATQAVNQLWADAESFLNPMYNFSIPYVTRCRNLNRVVTY